MSQFVHTLRFVVGLAMLVGGVMLVQPFAAAVGAARRPVEQSPAAGTMPPVGMPQPGWPTPQQGGHRQPAATGHAIPDPRPMQAGQVPMGQMQMTQGVAFGDPSASGWPAGLAADHVGPMAAVPPPPPPTPLPPSGLEFSPAPPQLVDTYRSTVEIPPPPLLDAQAPPPLAAGWVAHDVPQAAAHPPAPAAAEAVASVYVVRDGDDLTRIALRVYGHAGAAHAIWMANRDRLADPQLLPIGMTLRMPPAWTLPAAHASQSGSSATSIEPALAAAGSAAPSRQASGAAVASGQSPWLRPAAAAAPFAGSAAVSPETASRGAAPASVRVAAGDSLESLAMKFYGDRAAATRIWQANRDQLRNPGLLVPGMELRLP